MSYEDIDNFLSDLAVPSEIPAGAAAVGLLAFKKMAAGVPEPSRATSGVNVAALSTTLKQLVSYSFEKDAAGLEGRGHAEYLLGCLEDLHPEGFVIPDPVFRKMAGVSPRESRDQLIALEQQSITMMEKLCSLVGDHTTGHTFRSFIQDAQRSIQKLSAYRLPSTKKTAGERIRARIKVAIQAHPAQVPSVDGTGKLDEALYDVDSGKARKKEAAAPVVVPPPNMDSSETYVARERQLQLDQAMQELAHTKMQLNSTAQMMQQTQQEGQEAQQQLQGMEQQVQETQAMADQSSQESQASQQQAVEAEGRAAEHASQKMQLGMRVQQMRQALAEIATQDPVTEVGANTNDLAAQGAPATPDQMAQEEQAAAEQEQAAAGQPPAPAEAQEEAEQADRAAGEADQQAQQAEQAAGPGAAPAGPATDPAGGMAAA
ncbi:MAG: hypothetical protein DRQ64_00115 [Gammaproteobacteria bacterium]|nr:MAG: hypothetical protein DRQ64_00115 [Gammaproteobacteria bacterium]